jgi:hypothetical protein
MTLYIENPIKNLRTGNKIRKVAKFHMNIEKSVLFWIAISNLLRINESDLIPNSSKNPM